MDEERGNLLRATQQRQVGIRSGETPHPTRRRVLGQREKQGKEVEARTMTQECGVEDSHSQHELGLGLTIFISPQVKFLTPVG